MLTALPLRARITASFGIILALVASLSGWSLWSMDASLDAFGHYREIARISAGLAEVRAEFFGARLAAESYLLNADADQLGLARERLAAALHVQEQTSALTHDPTLKRFVEGHEQEIAQYRDLFAAKLALVPLTVGYHDLLTLGRAVTKHLAADDAKLQEARNTAGPVIDAGMKRSMWYTKIFAPGALGIGLLVAFLLGRGLSGEISGFADAMSRLAAGDRAAALPQARHADALGRMAAALLVFRDNAERVAQLETEQAALAQQIAVEKREAMGTMADRFEAEVTGVARAVVAAAEQLQANARAMNGAANGTTQQSRAVASASRETSANVQTVAAAAEELAASVAEIGSQVTLAASAAGQASGEAQGAGSRVSALAASVGRIGQVVELIRTIADQTNLLALNATIEAARAGEAGRGFAVVAAEVKELASQTAKATEEIGGQIGAVQGDTDEVVRAISEVSARIEQVNEISTAIASAVQEQGAAVTEIARNVAQAAQGTEEVTQAIAGVSQAAQETGEVAGEMVAAAGALTHQGEVLTAQIGQFTQRVRAA